MTRGPAGALTGKSALITGASAGIGAAAARVFCREGARVTLVARREPELAALTAELTAAGHQAQYVVADVTRSQDAARAVATAVESYGGLHAAFNNAGLAALPGPMHLMDDEIYDSVMDTNARGVWNCMRPELAAMLESGGGSIVNNSSTAGLVATVAGSPYIAAKHAVIGLTKAAAKEYAPHGIRVNVLATGATRSEMLTGWLAADHPARETAMASKAMLNRLAETTEIAEAAAWLCADHSSYITGTTLPVDGGRLAN
ncbi:SDR family oxidoreductase (plasmid) [Streptomyces sp. NBC_00536]|uniref:SDR family NAD(P)-dependent oxidoreductase n=1 Tax=Streptomyces sp. NBC_00536 TaxID=2975769 RepID=UPI002E8050EB|nr:SDR family oxidoreductase [Streptomyces sp. NBC_00536]WUC84289.1 SDR family oxidoreductase [Streptomyces sp. NBC_00536]